MDGQRKGNGTEVNAIHAGRTIFWCSIRQRWMIALLGSPAGKGFLDVPGIAFAVSKAAIRQSGASPYAGLPWTGLPVPAICSARRGLS